MKILVSGQLVEYKDEGKGKVIVLLHGWGSNLASLNDLAAFLAKKYRVIRLDFPGFGSSPKPDDSWAIQNYAMLLGEFLKKIKVDVYAIAGHSFGGRVIIKSIAKGFVNPSKVVLLGAAGVKPKHDAKKKLYKVIAKTGKVATSLPGLRKLQPKLREKLYESAGATDYLRAEAMRPIFLNTINEDLLPLVHEIYQPTLMVWGENDTEVPVVDAKKMHALIKNSKLVVVPGAGHYVFLDAPQAVEKELGAFLK